jgi:hypothetical protein
MLSYFIDNTNTDKNTAHSYLEVYEQLFSSKKESAEKILEIGVQTGGSLELWQKYFTNAEIYGIDPDVSKVSIQYPQERINIIKDDAYSFNTFKKLNTGNKFDIIIDDGPHTKESMIRFAGLYSQLLSQDGIMVIEDVQSIEWVNDIKKAFPSYIDVEVVDRRHVKGRWDDIMIIGKHNPTPKIIFVSNHHPKETPFARNTRKTFEDYTSLNGYGFYYDEEVPTELELYQLHYRRCISNQKAFNAFPDAQWFIWVDSDVFVHKNIRIENVLDLTNKYILYHLFSEKPWPFPINTGVKVINRDAMMFEEEIYSMRNTSPWDQFPYEQKTTAEYILPKIPEYYKIHEHRWLNHILYQEGASPDYSHKDAIFIHMCTRNINQRNFIIKTFLEESRICSYEEMLNNK